MNAQKQYLGALTLISIAVKAHANGSACTQYWNGLIKEAENKEVKIGAKGGDVQATISDPLAYFVVPLYGWNMFNAGLKSSKPKGRTVADTMGQLTRVLKAGYTTRADKIARAAASLTVEEMIQAEKLAFEGYVFVSLKGTSGNKEYRQSINNRASLVRQIRAVPEFKLETLENEI